MMKNLTTKNITNLHTNNTIELCSSEFKTFTAMLGTTLFVIRFNRKV
jgi:hypothetical protein